MTVVADGRLSDGTPIGVATYGAAELPEGLPQDGAYIVSTMFADAYRAQHPPTTPVLSQGGDWLGSVQHHTRPLLYVPDSGPTAIRENGQIVAVRCLIRR